jgi:hypothetical protein
VSLKSNAIEFAGLGGPPLLLLPASMAPSVPVPISTSKMHVFITVMLVRKKKQVTRLISIIST